MESVLEEAGTPSSPANLSLHHVVLRNQQNNDEKSLSPHKMEAAEGVHSPTALSSGTKEDTVLREKEKQGVCDSGIENIESENQDSQTKADNDRNEKTSESSLGKLDDREKGNGLEKERYLEVENKTIEDHCSARDTDDNVADGEDFSGKQNMVCGNGENTETRKITSSGGELVDSSIVNKVNESKCEMKVNLGSGHEREQEHNENGCKTEEIGHSGSEYPANENEHSENKNKNIEKVTQDEEESVGAIGNNEVIGKISGTEDSGAICQDVVMESCGFRDSENTYAESKDADGLTEDAGKGEGITSSDKLMVNGSDIGDSEVNNDVTQENDKLTEDLEETELAENCNLYAVAAKDAKEKAEVTHNEKEIKKSFSEIMDGEEMNIEMTEGKKEIDSKIREEKEIEMAHVRSGEKEGVERTEEKDMNNERTKGEERETETTEEKQERREEEQNVEMAEEKMDIERTKESKEIDVETAERKDMSSETSEETDGMDVQKAKEKEKESEIKVKGFEEATEVQEESGGSQNNADSSIMERSPDQISNDKEEKGKEFAEGKETQEIANETVTELREERMEVESQMQDQSKLENVTKEMEQDSAEENLFHRDEDETCVKKKDGANQSGQSDPLKESQKQAFERDLESLKKETNKDIMELTTAEELENKTSEEQTSERDVDDADEFNAAEDPLSCTGNYQPKVNKKGKYQPKMNKKGSKRGSDLHVPNPEMASPKQNEPQIQVRKKRSRQSKEEVEKSNNGQSNTKIETLNRQEIEKSNSKQGTQEKETLNRQRKVHQDTPTRRGTKEADRLHSDCMKMEAVPKVVHQSHSGKRVTQKAGLYSEKNNVREIKQKGIRHVTLRDEKRNNLNTGEAVCDKIPTGKNSIAKKSTSNKKYKIPQSSNDQSINSEKQKGRQEQRRERGGTSQCPSAKEAHNKKVGHVTSINTDHPGGHLTPVPGVSQQTNQTEKKQDSDDSDVEIISENIVLRSNISLPRSITSRVCDLCYLIWNTDVLEAIFEGTKAVTVNSKITYGAILCFDMYADIHYKENKEETLRNVLERADLSKNIGNVQMTDVTKWLSHMIKENMVKCCDVFDAVYKPLTATSLHCLLNSELKDASKSVPGKQNTETPTGETLKRKMDNSSSVFPQSEATSTTPEVALPKVTNVKGISTAVQSRHTQEATLEKSNAHFPNKNSDMYKNHVNHDVALKECSVNLGVRVQVPQHKACSQSVSNSLRPLSKRRQSLKEVDDEVPCKKKGRVSELPLSGKECGDRGSSTKTEDKKEAAKQRASKRSSTVVSEQCNKRKSASPSSDSEHADTDGSHQFDHPIYHKDAPGKTASEKSRSVVSEQTLKKDTSLKLGEENAMHVSDTLDDAEETKDFPHSRGTTYVPNQLGDGKGTAELEQKMNESEENKREKVTVSAQEDLKEKSVPQDCNYPKRSLKRNRTPFINKEKIDETNTLQVEHKAKRVKQVVPTEVLTSNSLPKQKKRPHLDPQPRSLKKQKILIEAQSYSQDEDRSKYLSESNEKLTSAVKTRRRSKRFASTDSRDSESSSVSLQNTDGSLSDETPRCESSGESDHKTSGKRLVSPTVKSESAKTSSSPRVLRTRSQSTPAVKEVVNSPKVLRPRSQKTPAGKEFVCDEDSLSDSCDQQISDASDLTVNSKRPMDHKPLQCTENIENPTSTLVQQLGLNITGINLYCSVTDKKIITNGDMANKSSEKMNSIPALKAMLKERSNLDGVAREAFDLLPFESSNFSSKGYKRSKERFLTNQELLVIKNICVLNPEKPDVNMFYQILTQILLARKRVLLVPNSLTLLLVAEGIRREFNRAKRKGNYVLYLAQDWDADKVYTAEDFLLGYYKPPNIPYVHTVLSMFCLWKNLEKRVPISFPIALEELCRNLVSWDVDKIGICVRLYSRYCTFLYEEKNLNLTQFFLNQPFLASQTEFQKETLLGKMTGKAKQDQAYEKQKPFNYSFNVSENDVQVLMKKCMEAEQAVLQSSSPKDEENFQKSVQALKYKVDGYKKEINQIQKVIRETQKKKSHLLSNLSNPQFKNCMKELSKTIESLYLVLSKRSTNYEVIEELENMSVKEVNRIPRPPTVVLKSADLGEDVSDSMKELVYDLLVNEVKIEEVRPALCAIVQNLSNKDLSIVPTNTWIRNFARVAGLKVRTRSNVLRW